MKKVINATEEVSDLGVFVDRLVGAAASPRHLRANQDYVDVNGEVACLDRNAEGILYRFSASFDERIRGRDRRAVCYWHDYTHSHSDGGHDTNAYVEEQIRGIAGRVRQRVPVLNLIIEGSRLRVESIMHALSTQKSEKSKI